MYLTTGWVRVLDWTREERAGACRLKKVGGCLDWRREEQAGAVRL